RWKAKTGPDGKFRISGIHSGGIRFQLTGRGVSPKAEMRQLGPENDFAAGRSGRPLEFSVAAAGRATGRGVAGDGSPVARARIFGAPARGCVSARARDCVASAGGMFAPARDPAKHGGSAADGEIRTDEKGAFLVDD